MNHCQADPLHCYHNNFLSGNTPHYLLYTITLHILSAQYLSVLHMMIPFAPCTSMTYVSHMVNIDVSVLHMMKP